MIAEFLRERGGLSGLLGHSLVKNMLLLYGVQFSTYMFPLITLPYLARVLEPDRLGAVFFAQSFIWYFIVLTDYGFGLSATRKISVHRANPAEVSRIFSAVMSAKLLLLVFGFLLMEAIVFATPKLRGEWLLYTVTYLNVLGNVLFPIWFFQGMQRMEQVALRDFSAKLSGLILLLWLVHGREDYIWAAGIQSGAMGLAAILGLTQVRRVCAVHWRWAAWNSINEELREGWPIFWSMATVALTGSTNVVILGMWATEAEVGYYSSAFRVVVAIRMMVSPVSTVIYPHVSRLASQNRESAIEFLRKFGTILCLPFAGLSLLLLVSAPWLVLLVFGSEYSNAIPLLQILAPSPFLLALAHNYSTYYMLPHGYDRQWSRILTQGAVLNFVILFPLLLIMPGGYAVAITTLAMDIYSAAATYLFYRRTERHT